MKKVLLLTAAIGLSAWLASCEEDIFTGKLVVQNMSADKTITWIGTQWGTSTWLTRDSSEVAPGQSAEVSLNSGVYIVGILIDHYDSPMPERDQVAISNKSTTTLVFDGTDLDYE